MHTMIFFLIHKLFQTNCLQALGSSLVFGSIIYLFFLLFIKSPIFSLLIPLDLIFTYHCFLSGKVQVKEKTKIVPVKEPVNEINQVVPSKVILKKLPAPQKTAVNNVLVKESIKYVQRLPKIRDTLHFTVQNLGI